MVIILLTSLACVRRRFYEIFIKSHTVLAVTAYVTIWMHLPHSQLLNSASFYLVITAGVLLVTYILQAGQALYRTISYSGGISDVVIHGGKNAILLHVRPAHPWEFRAGQYIYLCFPGLTSTAWLQFHPFLLAYWYKDKESRDVIVLIIEPGRGLTRAIQSKAGLTLSQATRRKVIIDGPYGRCLSLDLYGTVLLIASGIGIAGQLPYVKQLLEGYHSLDVKTRRIALFWEMSSERTLVPHPNSRYHSHRVS